MSNDITKNDSGLIGYWDFEKDFSDSSKASNNLKEVGSPPLYKDKKLSGAVSFDGKKQFLETENPVIDTTKSYTIAAWVRIDRLKMGEKLSLSGDKYALTAVSQDTKTHSNFYLGIRKIEKEQSDGALTSSLRWNFTVAPIDGSVTGAVEWQHAHSEAHLTEADFDKWFLLIGVCDAENRSARIYIPNVKQEGEIKWPEDLVQLPPESGLIVGRGRWLGRDVDFWPGSVGPIKIFSKVLSGRECQDLYTNRSL